MPHWHRYRAVRVIITINGRISRTETGFHETGLNSHHFIPGDEIGRGETLIGKILSSKQSCQLSLSKNGSY